MILFYIIKERIILKNTYINKNVAHKLRKHFYIPLDHMSLRV